MKIYTRTGDDGTTGLFGGGRVRKNHHRVEVYGTVDELNSTLGVARSHLGTGSELGAEIDVALANLQNDLFVLGSDLATPRGSKARPPRISEESVAGLETLIDGFEARLEPLTSFILPAGTRSASWLHLARTVCRRAERLAVSAAADGEELGETALIYLNRLSDTLFVLARAANLAEGVPDEPWMPAAS